MTESWPGLLGFRIAATSSAGLDWPAVDAIWAAAGELDVFSAGWMSDHLSDASLDGGGVAFESLATAAALAHRVPGKWIGIAVVSNTFRHPAVVAKAATLLDNVTAGRFILGLGAGWHEGEHRQFGIPLPPILERFDRYEHAVETIHALFSDEARAAPGVTRPDPFYPLDRATIEPPSVRPGGPLLWLGGQRRRGIALAARLADGWIMPGNVPGNLEYFIDRRRSSRPSSRTAGIPQRSGSRASSSSHRTMRACARHATSPSGSWPRAPRTSRWASCRRRAPMASATSRARSPSPFAIAPVAPEAGEPPVHSRACPPNRDGSSS